MGFARLINRHRRALKAVLYFSISAVLLYAVTNSGNVADRLPFLKHAGSASLESESVVVVPADSIPAPSVNLTEIREIVGVAQPDFEDHNDELREIHIDVHSDEPHNYTLNHVDTAPQPQNNMLCTDVIEISGEEFTFSEHFSQHIDSYKAALVKNNLMERNLNNESSVLLHEIARMPFVKTVCETFFGSGASTFQWLAAEDDIVVHSFTMLNTDYSQEMSDFMYTEFPDAFYLHEGDPKVYVPDFLEDLPGNFSCDVLFLDSQESEEAFKAHLLNFRQLMSPEDHLILVNSRAVKGALDGPWKVWDDLSKNGTITEDFSCSFRGVQYLGVGEQGLTVGSYKLQDNS